MKRPWIKKCCSKFKKPTGVPGDPKRDMILRCQQIQQRIHAKTASVIKGVDSGGDESLPVSDEQEVSSEEEQEVMAAVWLMIWQQRRRLLELAIGDQFQNW
jgi:hypothetical protein